MITRPLLSIALLLHVAAPARAAEPQFKMPPPDLAHVLPLVSPALDKPALSGLPAVYPPSPQPVPPLPRARVETDLGLQPIAAAPPPRFLACNPLGSVLGVVSELVECGRARFQRGEYEDAREALEGAIKRATEAALLREARYWLGETLIRLGRPQPAAQAMLLVVQSDPRSDVGQHAALKYAWLSLMAGEPSRALGTLDALSKSGTPASLGPWVQHGRAVALYGLGRDAEAREVWARLLRQTLPAPVAGEAPFWFGDTLGRLGEYKEAVARLKAFTDGGPGLLVDTALLRLAWWGRAAGEPLAAVQTYRGMMSAYPKMPEIPWARAGLVLALLDLDDYAAALDEARGLDAADKTGALGLPALLAVDRWATEKNRADDARALEQELLGRTLEPATRAYVLLLAGEVERNAGQLSDARSRFELVAARPVVPALGWYAGLRLAQVDLESREIAQARARIDALLNEPLTAELRAAALAIGGEAAYGARAWDEAAGHYSRFLAQFPTAPQAPSVMLALGWAEFRRGRLEAARETWTRFATTNRADPRAPAALLLAAEIAARSGDTVGAPALFDALIARYPEGEYADIARLDRSILAIRAGRGTSALGDVTELIRRTPLSPYTGRMRLARGVILVTGGNTAEAAREFKAAQGQGEGALANLGLGRVAFDRGQWGEAEREFVEARDAGAGAVAASAEYGIAAALWNQGKTEDFNRFASALLARPADPTIAPNVLAAAAALAAAEGRWKDARVLAMRAVNEFPTSDGAPAALSLVGGAAARGGEWPLASEAFQLLTGRYPGYKIGRETRLHYAEALYRTGALAEAQARLQEFIDASPADPELPRALVLLGRVQEAGGDRAAALDLYRRVEREYPAHRGAAFLGNARVLLLGGNWDEARPLLERAVAAGDAAVAVEAAYRLGEGLRAAGHHQQAVESYMTAAYVAPDTWLARRALLGAGQSFTALKQAESAIIVYKKLLAGKSVEPELADAAKKGLRTLGAN
jgi:tetratricopeptide (TPR) repeat protein